MMQVVNSEWYFLWRKLTLRRSNNFWFILFGYYLVGKLVYPFIIGTSYQETLDVMNTLVR